jgi:hypothetical protein
MTRAHQFEVDAQKEVLILGALCSMTGSSMQLHNKFKTFLGMTHADRWRVCEAILLLALAQLVSKLPFHFVAPWLARAPATSACDQALALRVRKAVTVAARNVPWNAVCLPQAMAAKTMLARRGCGSTLHLVAGSDARGKLIGHAWLVAGGMIVVGAAGIGDVAPVARFG